MLLVLYFYSHEVAVASAVFGHWPSSLSHAAFTCAVGYWVTYALYGIVSRRSRESGDRQLHFCLRNSEIRSSIAGVRLGWLGEITQTGG